MALVRARSYTIQLYKQVSFIIPHDQVIEVLTSLRRRQMTVWELDLIIVSTSERYLDHAL